MGRGRCRIALVAANICVVSASGPRSASSRGHLGAVPRFSFLPSGGAVAACDAPLMPMGCQKAWASSLGDAAVPAGIPVVRMRRARPRRRPGWGATPGREDGSTAAVAQFTADGVGGHDDLLAGHEHVLDLGLAQSPAVVLMRRGQRHNPAMSSTASSSCVSIWSRAVWSTSSGCSWSLPLVTRSCRMGCTVRRTAVADSAASGSTGTSGPRLATAACCPGQAPGAGALSGTGRTGAGCRSSGNARTSSSCQSRMPCSRGMPSRSRVVVVLEGSGSTVVRWKSARFASVRGPGNDKPFRPADR